MNGRSRASSRRVGFRQKKHVVIEDDTIPPKRPVMVRVPTKAEFSPKDLEDEEEEDGEEEVAAVAEPAARRATSSDVKLPLHPTENAAPTAHTYYAPPPPQPTAQAQRREGRVTPPLPLPQPKAILKKVSAYQLPPAPSQPPTLNGGGIHTTSSDSTGTGSGQVSSSHGNSSLTQAPPLGMGPTRRSMRQLSFADELGQNLHEVTHAHNLQYGSNHRQSAPMACCAVS